MALNNTTLAALPPSVSPPGYRRELLEPAVVHIGVGHFHRAHEAVYLDDLARLGERGWGLVGVGLHRPEMGEVLSRQDDLYLLLERHERRDHARVVGAMTRYLFAPDDPEAVLATLADPRTRLVTLTITGPGYRVGPRTGEFDAGDAEVAADLAEPSRPRTVFGYVVEALARRRRHGDAPFTVLSCDNMRDNGAAARTAIVSFAALRDPDLAAWIDRHVAFPSSMVDGITPATSVDERHAITAEFGVDDGWPVVTEPYRQWIVEDRFCNGRPPWEQVGVQLVPDVAPYQAMKTRLLNASHCALGFLGTLGGHTTTCETLADPVFAAYLDHLMADEVSPLLAPSPGIDVAAYRRSIARRLRHPRMGDPLERLRRRGAWKVGEYLVPSIAESIERGRSPDLLVLAVAGWLVLESAARGVERAALLADADAFGPLSRDPRFAAAARRAVGDLQRLGAHGAITARLPHTRGSR
ncbi:mannitol dehydrogenase family protein [Aeromicrobium sp. 179-A 4D2 NHS]|uniref:mannitol dehydrogenase family protein n=1 Tax=Aeromicrobium sp. 179-A 4D2 NHS TaxID=3142375 RepID=UPI0039A30A2D